MHILVSLVFQTPHKVVYSLPPTNNLHKKAKKNTEFGIFLTTFDSDMRHIDFDDLWKNHQFDYKDGDLLVIDDITRLNLSDYENTTLAFVMAVFCMEGRLQCVVEGREYRIGSGDFFVYMPGQVIGEILLSQNADVKVIAFAQRAIDRSLYLNKFV